jgi:hypothetical protein
MKYAEMVRAFMDAYFWWLLLGLFGLQVITSLLKAFMPEAPPLSLREVVVTHVWGTLKRELLLHVRVACLVILAVLLFILGRRWLG